MRPACVQWFGVRNQKAAAALNKGDDVTVTGHVDGLMMNVLVKDCVINPHIRICEKFRPSLGGIKCAASDFGARMTMLDGTELAAMFVPTKKLYDAAAPKFMEQASKDVMTLKSDEPMCFAMIGHDKKPVSPDLIAKTQKALDSL